MKFTRPPGWLSFLVNDFKSGHVPFLPFLLRIRCCIIISFISASVIATLHGKDEDGDTLTFDVQGSQGVLIVLRTSNNSATVVLRNMLDREVSLHNLIMTFWLCRFWQIGKKNHSKIVKIWT